eukprot:TRINITY_DN7027_c0_g1_i1.p1 TRINITY_DN7027_c0_g1~~TRINITY_DN7027_c0_g1_i1.p1  ORF type:complete len:416 (-),score=186.86 TRINITY_DN7027_c0_g1_i1:340-1587(-)
MSAGLQHVLSLRCAATAAFRCALASPVIVRRAVRSTATRPLDSDHHAVEDFAMVRPGLRKVEPRSRGGKRSSPDLARANMALVEVSSEPEVLQKRFEQMAEHDLISFNSVIIPLIRAGLVARAADYFERMLAEIGLPDGIMVAHILGRLVDHFPVPSPDEALLLTLIRDSGFRCEDHLIRISYELPRLGSVAAMERYVNLLQSIGGRPDLGMFNIMIDAAVKAKDLQRAQYYFDLMAKFGMQPNAISYTSLLDGLVHTDRLAEAHRLLATMRSRGIQPTAYTMSVMIRASGIAGRVDLVDQFVKEALALPVLEDARYIFNAAIKACCRCRDYFGVCSYLSEMIGRGFTPTDRTAWALLGPLRNYNDAARALQDSRFPAGGDVRMLRPDEVALLLDFAHGLLPTKAASSDVPDKRR